jgi:hypothetical protein
MTKLVVTFWNFANAPKKGGLVADLSSRRLDRTLIHVRFVVDCQWGRIFCAPSTSVSPCQYHCTTAPHSSSFTYCCYQKDKRARRGNLQKTQCSRGADKSLARPRRKQATATKPAEMSNIRRWKFGPLDDNQWGGCRLDHKKSRWELFQQIFVFGRAKDLLAPRAL